MADITVNRAEWESLSAEDQQDLMRELKVCGALGAGDSLSPGDDAPDLPEAPAQPSKKGFGAHTDGSSCDDKYNAAVAQCKMRYGGDGVMLVACIVKAGVDRAKCKGQ